MKSLVYETPVPSVEYLAAHISLAAIKLSEMPGIIHSVIIRIWRRFKDCRAISGQIWEPYL